MGYFFIHTATVAAGPILVNQASHSLAVHTAQTAGPAGRRRTHYTTAGGLLATARHLKDEEPMEESEPVPELQSATALTAPP